MILQVFGAWEIETLEGDSKELLWGYQFLDDFGKTDMGEVVLKVHKELIRYYLKQKNSSESKGNVVLEERVKAIRYYFLSKIIVK